MLIDEKRLQDLKDYYKKNREITFVGVNSSQLINLTPQFLTKGLLESLANDLKGDLNPTIINAASLTMNKTEHIDYILDANLSLEEIKLSQVYGFVSALRHVMENNHLPTFLGEVGALSKLIYKVQKEDKKIYIKDLIRDAKEPVIVYASGENNLMREVGNNPAAILKDYQRRRKTPNYDYSLEKARDPKTLSHVVEGIERNFNHILTINENADIYALGCYATKNMEKEELKVFKELVLAYNDRLKELCKSYNCSYISTQKVGSDYLMGDKNFHATLKGHAFVKNNILFSMYERKIGNPTSADIDVSYAPKYNLKDRGSSYVEDACTIDIGHSYLVAKDMYGYEKKRKLAEENEHVREAKIFRKVNQKVKN